MLVLWVFLCSQSGKCDECDTCLEGALGMDV